MRRRRAAGDEDAVAGAARPSVRGCRSGARGDQRSGSTGSISKAAVGAPGRRRAAMQPPPASQGREVHAGFTTLPARPSRKARSRSCASGVLSATAAISDSVNRPSLCAWSAMRGKRMHDREVGHRRVASRCAAASASALASACPLRTTVVRQAAAASAFVGVEDAAGQHQVGHARHADQARHAHRAAAADEDAALAFGQAVVGRCPRRRGCGSSTPARARRRPPRRAARRPPARGRTGSRRTRHATCANAARRCRCRARPAPTGPGRRRNARLRR